MIECNLCGWVGNTDELLQNADPVTTDGVIFACPEQNCDNHSEYMGFSEVFDYDELADICPQCSGSGEGQYETTHCSACCGAWDSSTIPRT